MIGGAQGLCFAVSSNTALFVLGAFLRHGRLRRAHLGLAAQTIALPRRIALATGAGKFAVRIGELTVEGPAERGGLRAGDIILTVDGVAIGGADDLMRTLDWERIGRSVEIRVLRAGKMKTSR